MYQVFLLGSLLLLASAQLDCPNPATECDVDPCEEASCPRFLTADCETNLCHGLCTANFFWRGRNVTDRCPVPRCASRQCSGKRVCVEEVTPSSCPNGQPKCRQYLDVRCILPPPIITDCDLLECPEGMVCRKRIQSDEVFCVVPRDCSQLECDDGLECIVQDRRAQCVPLSTTTSTAPPTTAPPTTTETSTVTVTSSPVTPTSSLCMQLRCERFGELCVLVDGQFPTCVPPNECIPVRENFCRSRGLVCVETGNTADCDRASSCDQLECSQGQRCREFSSVSIAFCENIPIAESCDDLDCDSLRQVCEQVNKTFAMCVERTSCTEEEEENCFSAVCVIVDGFQFCEPAESCDQIECPPEQDCLVRGNSEQSPSGNVAICSFVHPSCDSLTCNETSNCFSQGFPIVDLFLSTCITPSLAEIIRFIVRSLSPCTEQNLCNPVTEICVDSRLENGRFIRFFCIPTNCNDNTDCSFDEECLPVPLSTGIPIASVCVPIDRAFEFGPSCSTSGRECPTGTVCSNIVTDGQIVGTICDFEPVFSNTGCEALDCQADFPDSFCFEQSLDSGERLATCSSLNDTRSFIEDVRDTFGLSLSCDQFVCPRGTVCTEEPTSTSGISGGSSLASGSTGGGPSCEIITTAESCEELACERIFQVCEQVSETFATCVPVTCTEALEEQCRMRGDVCGVVNVAVVCHPPESCEELVNECPLQQGCVLRDSNLTPSGRMATCSLFTPSCDTLNCNEGSVCYGRGYASLDLFVFFCDNINVLRENLLIPCTVRDYCHPVGQVCVSSRLPNGDFVRAFCIDVDCISGSGSGSVNSSDNISTDTTGIIGSECLPIELEFEIGSSCAASKRQCPPLFFCTNIETRGQVVGTTCDSGEPAVRSCDALDCAGGDCLQSVVDGDIEYNTLCTSQTVTAGFVRELIQFLNF